ncbi:MULTISPECIES: methyl-accepting chemotaxis protein [unclassified Pseudodesulfovibrio]|uniref:methyl-accepting chemotaxis protein n=1 Tax=unclassified Pseudodesulfovibrio TaxID=2661612 RepID=UPI001F4F3F57|nr:MULTISPECIES: methyl-accepting chemotaxis protein [unclassified Pseudodesulfovibrio]MCJ2165741.1 methyl-accepting chemotaxis protein [Pseudodesulfovibrio sp. S3-i]
MMLEGEKDKLKVASDAMAMALSELIGELPDEAARVDVIRKAINGYRFEEDKSGYFFVFKGTMTVAHAAKPSLNGKDLGTLKDSNGIYMIRELAEIAAKGGGFVRYIWPKPGAGEQPKLSYATRIPGTEYFIGTGVYIDNIDMAKQQIELTMDVIVQESVMIIGVSFAVALIFVLVLSLFIIRSITSPIREATAIADAIAHGDYTMELNVKGRDEAAQLQMSLNVMAKTLRENIAEITARSAEANEKTKAAEMALKEADMAKAEAERARREGAHQAVSRIQEVVNRVSAAAEQMSRQASIIDEGTTVQRDRIQGTATAMNQMNATVLEVARNAAEASSMGIRAKDLAVEGAEIVSKSVAAMDTTYSAAEGLKSGMNRLEAQAHDIGKVLEVITDIADQTNLLALNAAIEAARAGEAGRGFAVVADEVRKLAEKTMQATKEVGDSIAAVQEVAKQNVTGMDKALSDLGIAVELSSKSGEVLKDIVEGVEESAGQINSIAAAAEEQSAASEEINQAIEEVNAISLETSQGVTESSQALDEMTTQMAELQAVIDRLASDSA